VSLMPGALKDTVGWVLQTSQLGIQQQMNYTPMMCSPMSTELAD